MEEKNFSYFANCAILFPIFQIVVHIRILKRRLEGLKASRAKYKIILNKIKFFRK